MSERNRKGNFKSAGSHIEPLFIRKQGLGGQESRVKSIGKALQRLSMATRKESPEARMEVMVNCDSRQGHATNDSRGRDEET